MLVYNKHLLYNSAIVSVIKSRSYQTKTIYRTKCHLVLYLFLRYKLLNMFWATLCPSSGADDLVVFLPCVV